MCDVGKSVIHGLHVTGRLALSVDFEHSNAPKTVFVFVFGACFAMRRLCGPCVWWFISLLW